MKVLMVASECAPFIKTGGLADVVGALPAALAAHGVDCRTLLPVYPSLQPLLSGAAEVAHYHDLPGGPARVFSVSARGVDLFLLDAPQLFDRPGKPYNTPTGEDWPDNHVRFAALSQVGARIGLSGAGGWVPDIVHAHDWQAGLTPVYLKQSESARPKSVITIHNIAFQGRCNGAEVDYLGLRRDWFTPNGFEYYGDISALKGGLVFADRITTVSPTYAREILTPEFGMGLDGVLRARRSVVSGILNGIDTEVWNPATDPALVKTYDARSLGRKSDNKLAVQARMGLDANPDAPLFCVISRLTQQKGLDALALQIRTLVERGGQLAVLGTGEPELEQAFVQAANSYPGRVGAMITYDEDMAHLLQGGSDAILIPSRFEPCGLTQLYGLRYGTLPVVSRTGGLADTVIDANAAALAAGCATGFVFDKVTGEDLVAALDRVFTLYADQKTWRGMQRAAMRQNVGWDLSAQAYVDLYRQLTE